MCKNKEFRDMMLYVSPYLYDNDTLLKSGTYYKDIDNQVISCLLSSYSYIFSHIYSIDLFIV
jgi:hypothetical protein